MHGRWYAVVFLALAAGPSIGCDSDESCTMAACSDMSGLELHTPDGTWAAGQYTLTVTVAGTTHLCNLTSPDDFPAETNQGGGPRCDGGGFWDYTHGPNPEWAFYMMFEGTPSNVVVNVQRDGAEILNEQSAIPYDDVSPNGVECGPTCRQGFVVMTLPAN